jgi:cytochrome P450
LSKDFVDLGVSFFDQDFTLDPFPYLEDLYGREEVLGFRADGMDFIFRFDQAQQIVRSRSCRREAPENAAFAEREKAYATLYPHRAKMFEHNYASSPGGPDFVTKKLMMDFLDEAAKVADFSGARPLYERLAIKGQEDEYVESVATLPLRVMLTSCGLAFTERELLGLQRAGLDYLKAFDNVGDESLLKAADEAVARVCDYLDTRLADAEPDARIHQLIGKGSQLGISEERMKFNIAGALIISLANTAGISSAFVLRTLIRYPDVRREFVRHPERIQDDHVVTELLRRDNHVKALSRFVHEDIEIGSFQLKKGEPIYLFFPGVSLDPAVYTEPLAIDLDRRFSANNTLVFGGSAYICIGKKLGIEFIKKMVSGFVEHLPDDVWVEEDNTEADGDWVVERIVTKLDIEFGY